MRNRSDCRLKRRVTSLLGTCTPDSRRSRLRCAAPWACCRSRWPCWSRRSSSLVSAGTRAAFGPFLHLGRLDHPDAPRPGTRGRRASRGGARNDAAATNARDRVWNGGHRRPDDHPSGARTPRPIDQVMDEHLAQMEQIWERETGRGLVRPLPDFLQPVAELVSSPAVGASRKPGGPQADGSRSASVRRFCAARTSSATIMPPATSEPEVEHGDADAERSSRARARRAATFTAARPGAPRSARCGRSRARTRRTRWSRGRC